MFAIKRIIAFLFLAASLQAQIVLSGGVTVSGGVRLSGAACQISTFTLPPGTVGVQYPATPITVAFCAQPVHFSIISGSLPSWATLDPVTGVLSGVPDAAGSSTFTVQVEDAQGNLAVFPEFLSIAVAPATGLPQLPDPLLFAWDTSMLGSPQSTPTKICVGTLNNAALVHCDTSYTASQYQTALNNAACGQTILLGSMTTFSYGDSFDLPNNVMCPDTNWLIITRDTTDLIFPGEGFQVDPCFIGIPQSALPYIPYPRWDACLTPARHMPQIITNSSGQNPGFNFKSPPATGPSESHVRFVGLDVTRGGASNNANFDIDFSLISLVYQPATDCAVDVNKNPVNAVACMNDQPDHFIFDRMLVHADPQRQTTRAFDLSGCRWCAIKDSMVYDVQVSVGGGGGDSQAIAWGGGASLTNKGWGKFTNDFLSAGSESGCLFCGAFTAPVSPATGFDGVPHDVLFDYDRMHKNPFMDVQLGTSFNQAETFDGFTYAAQPGPSLSVTPNTMQLQQGGTIQIDSTWLHDSFGGFNRMGNSVTTVSVDGFACPAFNSTALAAAITTGATTITVKSAAGWAVGQSILILGAGAANANYIGSVTAISGTTFTISPPTGGAAANGAQVSDPVCLPNGDSTHGLILRNSEHSVGTGGWVSANQVTYQYIACSGTGVPLSDCGPVTTPGAHGINFKVNTIDQTLSKLGNNLVLSSTSTITVTTGAPTQQIVVSPKDSTLQIQPSYSDANLNHRTFCYELFWNANYTPATVVWSVSPNGANDGTITTPTGVAANEAVYCSGSNTGVHTLTVTGTGGISDSSTINVTTLAPMVGADLKAFNSKNLFESKCVSKMQVSNSLFTLAWGGAGNGGFQVGKVNLFQPINQVNQAVDGSGHPTNYGPMHIDNVTMLHDHWSSAGGGFDVAALSGGMGIRQVLYSNIVVDDLDYRKYGHGMVKIYPTLNVQGAGNTSVPTWTNANNPLTSDIFYKNMTITGAGTAPFGITNNALQFKLNNAVWQNILITAADPAGSSNKTFINSNGENGDCTPNGGGSNNDLEINYLPPCFNAYTYDHIALLDSTAAATNFLKPTLVWPASTASIGFVNPAVGDYRLCTDVGVPAASCTGPSLYAARQARQGADGNAMGADIAAQAVIDNQVRSGVAAPLVITTNSLANCHVGVTCTQTLTATGGMAPYTWTVPANPSLALNAIDLFDYLLMPQSARNNFHMNGSTPKYFVLDSGMFWWIKASAGNPWDGWWYDKDFIYFAFTEDGDAADQPTCVAAGFPACWEDPFAYKLDLSMKLFAPRYFIPGSTVTLMSPPTLTAGNVNPYQRTTNCGVDNQPTLFLGNVKTVTSGPTTIAWGGSVGTVPTVEIDYYYSGNVSGVYSSRERYWLAKGFGQIQWDDASRQSDGSYLVSQTSNTFTKVAGGPPVPNFGCKVPTPPFAMNGVLPPSTSNTSSAPTFNLIDFTGDLTGKATTTGTTNFVVQVSDAAGNVVAKNLSLTVVP